MTVAFPQDNVLLPTGKLSQSWQRFFQNFASGVGDVTPFNPAVSSAGGALTSAFAQGSYQVINGWVFWQIGATVSNNGTGSGSIIVNLPFPTRLSIVGTGQETFTFTQLQCTQLVPVPTGHPFTAIAVTKYDGTYPITAVNGFLRLQVIYRVT